MRHMPKASWVCHIPKVSRVAWYKDTIVNTSLCSTCSYHLVYLATPTCPNCHNIKSVGCVSLARGLHILFHLKWLSTLTTPPKFVISNCIQTHVSICDQVCWKPQVLCLWKLQILYQVETPSSHPMKTLNFPLSWLSHAQSLSKVKLPTSFA